ncbi:hypothetical protein ACA910_004397 [Epithemia clementina (nom. ined.)]
MVSKQASTCSTTSASSSSFMSSQDLLQEWTPTRMQRIPTSLQTVFLRSNRGEEVNKAPPERMGQRTFFQNIFFRRASNAQDQKKKVYDATKDKVLAKSTKITNPKPAAAAAETIATIPPQSKSNATTTTTTPPPEVTASSSGKTRQAKGLPKQEEAYTLQEYFDALLRERGYVIKLYNTLDTAYYNNATALQVASYGPRMVRIVREANVHALRETLAVGLSPNPCNQFGESLLHMVCRRGDLPLLNVMIEAGSSLQVSDDYGRTPLHDAFWAANPACGVVETILRRDPGLFFMKDKRGALPLSYVTKSHWSDWMKWFDENIDRFFSEDEAKFYHPAELVLMKPNSFSLPEPKTDLSLELIKMVAYGDLSPQEARIMSEAARDGDDATAADTLEDEDLTSLYDEDDDDSDLDSDEYDSEDDDDDEDEYGSDNNDELDVGMEGEDLVEMLQMARLARSIAR